MKKIILILLFFIAPVFSFAGSDTWGFTTSQKDGIILNTGGTGTTNTGIDILTTETDIVVSQGGGGVSQNGISNCPDKPQGSIANVFNYATCLISKGLIPLVIGIAFVFFVWNAINYIKSAEKSEKRVEAAEYMLWSVVAFTVMVTVFGIVRIIINTIE
mgnify:CR=1 FL=1